ncbi:unnamed protein product [Candidula unifasciata]|uniref:Mitogen-activated protein kinase kinase kinase 4 n=1 Tax=Candidula unifasciata TaxID=100452 RepID=A0A8S3YJG7_9EUPU|nr:unnamed protein product [Candidula unifasciata]
MADEPGADDEAGSISPKEDFNPLADDQYAEYYLRQVVNGAGEVDDEGHYQHSNYVDGTEEAPYSDDELDSLTLGQVYSITPPNLPRVRKREHEKERQTMKLRHPDRSYKEFLISKRHNQPKSVANIIKTEYMSDPALCNLTEFDSDDNLDKESIREKREKRRRESRETKKTLSKLRLNDRQEKRLSEDFSAITINDSMDGAHLNGMKLEGSGRFSLLKPKPIAPLTAECRARRQVGEPPVCPRDREEFHSKFSLLINLGTEAKKDKEKMMSSNKRQLSVELEQWRASLIEQLWLELRAYINGISPEEQHHLLKMERQEYEKVIDEINSFCFTDTIANEYPNSALGGDSYTRNPHLKVDGTSFRELVSRSVSASFSDVNLTDETVCLQEKALFQVQSLLERLDHYESCFSTTEAAKQSNPKFKDPEFQRRVKCLNLWLNITCDLCQKLKLFGRIIGTHSRGIKWPLVNFEFPKPRAREFLASPRASIPNVMETEATDSENEEANVEEDEEEVEEEEEERSGAETQLQNNKTYLSPHHKQVKFQCGDDSSDQGSPISSPVPQDSSLPMNSSTPVQTFSQSNSSVTNTGTSVLSLSRASSEVSLDDSRIVKSSIYRHYVEKCLRKMGLHKLNLRLRDLFHGSLKRAKEALERPKESTYSNVGESGEEQLIRECKEVLKGASLVKQYYHYMVAAVMWDEMEAEDKFESDLTEFDEDMKSMLDVYFNYLQSWIYMLQSLPEASLGMKSALEEEWTFTKSICAFVVGGEAEAGKKFSSLASSLLNSIGDFLDNGIDDNTRSLYDDEYVSDFADGEEGTGSEQDSEADSDNTEDRIQCKRMAKMKQNVQGILRNFRNLFNEARERASKALGFAKLLRKDLEIAADFNIAVTTKDLFTRLMETRHVQVKVPLSSGYMMFIPEKIISNKQLILQLLNVTSGREDMTETTNKEEGYLLMLRCESGIDHIKECPRWTGFVVHVEPTAETAIALSHIEVMGFLFVVTHSGALTHQRKYFESIMGKTVQLVNEQTSCHQSIAESLSELKANAVELMVKISQAIQQVNEKLNVNEVILTEESILKLYRETMLKIYDFGFEYQRELMRLVSRDQRQKMCHMTVSFAKDWMNFVISKCERGRGTRPRWATQGLEFITIACEPKNVVYLTDEEFQDFQHRILDCLTHIIGSSDNRYIAPGLSLSRSNLDLPRSGQPLVQRLTSCPENSRFIRSVSARSVNSDPTGHHTSGSLTSTPSSINSFFFGDNILSEADRTRPRGERLRLRIEKLELGREQKLRESRIIGRVTNHVQEPDYRINVRRVNFRWQRGIKIGEGQFGKVYTAVNINTGELMAMKEMKFQPNDQQSLKEICDEIKNFEGINHKNLVKYFGVEVHKDEMLMFMEYCDSGSIEEVARIGLPEYMIRRYTQEIVRAIVHLHENNIVHRDIKGANIFLTSQGHVKLGDFGCSVKLKNQQTMPGENVNLVGTTAYMAPEVITQSKQEGYGRAADIWSLGCVVIEMATGKRPWHELEHNLQVMFKVGTGHTPPIPENLGKDGKSFLACCLVHEPEKRWTAAALLDHMFVKYYDVEENDEDSDES